MGFYYARERKRFDRKWDKLRKEYEAAGMSQESIQLMYDFDLKVFCSERTYVNHTQPLPSESIGSSEAEQSSLFRKFKSSSTSTDELSFYDRYGWVDTIEDQRLILLLRKLTDEDLELLTFLVLEEHSQRELAQKWGCNQKAISRKFLRIKKFLK